MKRLCAVEIACALILVGLSALAAAVVVSVLVVALLALAWLAAFIMGGF